MANWLDWMNDLFSPAVPPPPLVVADPTQPGYPPGAPPLPSPVPGCNGATWAAYEALLTLREGVKYKVYYDSLGKPTGGIGHLLLPSDGLVVGEAIPDATVQRWFQHDGATAMDYAVTQAKQAGITSQAFLPYLASVCYQLGGGWTHTFPNTWKLIIVGQYGTVANSLVTTDWYRQTPTRVADFQKALRALPPKVAA